MDWITKQLKPSVKKDNILKNIRKATLDQITGSVKKTPHQIKRNKINKKKRKILKSLQ